MKFGKYVIATVLTAIMMTTSFGMLLSLDTDAEKEYSFVKDGFGYEIYQDDYVTVYGIEEKSGELKISSTVEHDGRTYVVVAVGNNAFNDKKYNNVTSIVIENGVVALGDSSFAECTSVTSISLPESLTMIGEGAFVNAPNVVIEKLFIPKNLEKMGNAPFGGCNVKVFEVDSGNEWFFVEDGFLYGNEGKDLIQAPYKHFDSLAIKDGVKIIRSMACYRIEADSLIIPSSVIHIDYFAFSTSEIDTITFAPNSCLESIEDYAFYESHAGGTLTIPGSVGNIGCKSFYHCNFEKIVIGNNVRWIGDHAFEYCETVNSLVLGNSVEMIGVSAFGDCKGVKEIIIPASVKYICDCAFWGGKGVNVRFLGGEPTMGRGCFDIDNPVFNAEWGSFADFDYFVSKGYKDATVNGKKYSFEEKEFSSIDDRHNNITYTFTTNVDGTVRMTKMEVTGTATDVVIPNVVKDENGEEYNVTGICCQEFPDNVYGKLTLPNTLTTIDDEVFKDCDNLTGELRIPASVYRLGTDAFSKCDGFTKLTFEQGSKLVFIPGAAFDQCSNIDGNLKIPDSVEIVGYISFRSMEKIDSVEFGNKVRAICGQAFMGCTELKNITLNDDLKYIGYYSFKDSDLSCDLTIPSDLKYIGASAFASSGDMDGKTVTFLGDEPTLGASALFFGYNADKEIRVKIVTNGWGEHLNERVLGVFNDYEIDNGDDDNKTGNDNTLLIVCCIIAAVIAIIAIGIFIKMKYY